MCVSIEIDGKDVETMGQLAAIVGKENIVVRPDYPEDILDDDKLHCCLCPVDIKETARKNSFTVKDYTEHDGDPMWYIWERA